MRIVSLNARYGTADDGPHSWPHRRTSLIEVLRSLEAEVICLQEPLEFQVSEIADALTGHRWVGLGRDDGVAAGEFAPIFYASQLGEPKRSGTFWLSETPELPGSIGWNASQPRICTWAAWPGFKVFNAHLDHVSEEARARSTQLILERIGDVEGRTLVCGDFNDLPGSRTVRQMVESGFEDLGSKAGPTFNDFHPDVARACRIDYLFARGLSGTAAAQVVRTPLVSDHWPVVADL